MPTIAEIQNQFIEEFSLLETGNERFDYLIDMGQAMPPMAQEQKIEENLVKGCQSSVWLRFQCKEGVLYFEADSDSLIVKGITALLVQVLSGQPACEVKNVDMTFIETIGLWKQLSSQRGNGLNAMLAQIHHAAEMCASD